MGEVITIDLDIAKSVFKVHGVDGTGAVVIRRRVSRAIVSICHALSPTGALARSSFLVIFGGLARCEKVAD